MYINHNEIRMSNKRFKVDKMWAKYQYELTMINIS